MKKLTKSRQNLYRKPQTRDTLLPKIHPRVSIHLNVPKTPQSLSILPSSLFTLSLCLSRCARDLVRSHVRHANVPSFHHFLPRLAHPLPRCSRTLVPLCSLPLFTRRGNGGRRGRKEEERDERHCERGSVAGRRGWRLETRPTPYRGGSFLSVDWKKERGCAKPSPPPPPPLCHPLPSVLDSC